MKNSKRTELLARAILIEELLRQEKSIDHILEESIGRLREAVETIFRNKQFDNLEERLMQYMLQFDDELAKELNAVLIKAIEKGVESGSLQYLLITREVLKIADVPIKPFLVSQQRANQRAVEAAINKQIKGLNLSDRIWSTSKRLIILWVKLRLTVFVKGSIQLKWPSVCNVIFRLVKRHLSLNTRT